MANVPDVGRCVTMDLKEAGNYLLLIGLTLNEMGIGASLAGTVGVFEMTGGTLADAGWITVARGGTTSSGLLNASGGTITALRIDANWAATAGAASVINIGGVFTTGPAEGSVMIAAWSESRSASVNLSAFHRAVNPGNS